MNSNSIDNCLLKTSFGDVLGINENNIIKIKNIRYAQSKRFSKPWSVSPSLGNCITSDKTPACPQNISPLLEKMVGNTNIDDFEADEATQYLSVYRPQIVSEKEKLPVIIWVHGGSYEIGCGDVETADPTDWVKEQNVIVVCVSYRLGIFGFLGGTKERPANLGLFDIIEALKWVKNYITDFGGNSENITLFGQSSGADAIAHLMISDGVEGLFQNVIIQSAPLGLRRNRAKMSREFLNKTEHISSKEDVLEIINNYKKQAPSFFKYGLKAAMPFGVQYGFEPLCKEDETIKKWKSVASKYNVLIGVNDEETSFYLRASEQLKRYLPSKILNKAIRATTEKIYGKPAENFASEYAQAGGDVYLFRIYSKIDKPFSAAHAFDLPLLFGNKNAWKSAEMLRDIPWEYLHENGKQLRAIWANFARTGSIDGNTKLPEVLSLTKITS